MIWMIRLITLGIAALWIGASYSFLQSGEIISLLLWQIFGGGTTLALGWVSLKVSRVEDATK